jgi:cobyrinic acid a,c-diamide synthase
LPKKSPRRSISCASAAAVPLGDRTCGNNAPLPLPGGRIALARDEPSASIYPHVVSGWRRRRRSCRLLLADDARPGQRRWLPGGYPELHAARLAGAGRFMAGLRAFAATRAVHGECGGYMVLGTSLEDGEGRTHAMAGLLSHATSFARRRLTLGYREADVPPGVASLPAGPLRGHEFHYATVTDPGTDLPLATLRDGQGRDLGPAGGRRGLVSGSFFHAIAAA